MDATPPGPQQFDRDAVHLPPGRLEGEKGYGTALQELWTACRRLGVELPQDRPVAASSICKARMRVDEGIFLKLHGKILERAGDGALWNGRRVFAVDGTKMNLPRPLVERGYPKPNANAHYPQGLVSCLYRVDRKIPFDFSLSADACERAAAIRHLDALGPGGVVAFDRGCFSYDMIYEMAERGLDPVFRLQSGAAKALEEFMASGEDDAIAALEPGRDALRDLRKKRPGRKFEPLRARAVRYVAGKTEFYLVTTLLDDECFPLPALSDLYHGRWSIEELYKTSKGTIAVDEFHGQTERGVRQELYARFNLIALARLFANYGEERLARERTGEKQPWAVNFKNAVAMLSMHLETLLLRRAAALSECVNDMMASILAVRSRLRPGRSYERASGKPVKKWSRKRSRTPGKIPRVPAAAEA